MMSEASIPGCPSCVMLWDRAIPRGLSRAMVWDRTISWGEKGLGRGTPREIARFAQIALGSLYELDTLLYLASDLGYSPQDAIIELREGLTSLAKRTSAFILYQENRS